MGSRVRWLGHNLLEEDPTKAADDCHVRHDDRPTLAVGAEQVLFADLNVSAREKEHLPVPNLGVLGPEFDLGLRYKELFAVEKVRAKLAKAPFSLRSRHVETLPERPLTASSHRENGAKKS